MTAASATLPSLPSMDHRDPRVIIPIVAGIGNALMTVPMVRQLKRNLPDAHITILARIPAMGQVFERLEEVDQVMLMSKGATGMAGGMLRAARLVLPNVVVIPFPSNRWEYMGLALASGAKTRIIHSYPVGKLTALGIVPARRLPAVKGLHDVVQNLYLLRLLGVEPDPSEAPVFPITDTDRAATGKLLAQLGLPDDARPIAIHAGSARTILAQAKRWPAENYAQLITRLIERFGPRVVLLEGPDERGVAAEITRHIPRSPVKVLRLSGPLAHAAALLERSQLYVGTDSGLAHLAAAVGTPPITLFAPADPDRVCPFGHRRLVVQPPCDCCPCLLYPWEATKPKLRHPNPTCIRKITVEQVMEAVEQAASHT